MKLQPPDPLRERSRIDLGILGGMGPLASAAFLDTLYRESELDPEQAAPSCVVWSDPAVPDRTEKILEGRSEELVGWLRSGLERLVELGAERLVVACVTAHVVFPDLPEDLRRRTLSLLDLALEEAAAEATPFLVLATTGTRRVRLFESHPDWPRVEGLARWPRQEEQEKLHELIYRIKAGADPASAVARVEALARGHGVERALCGCTELHLVARSAREAGGPPRFIDPLTLAACRLARRELAVPGGGSA